MKIESIRALGGPILILATILSLSPTAARAAKFHKVYEEVNSAFSPSDLDKQVVRTDDGSFYALLDGGDGLLLTRTDGDGNLVWSHLYGDFADNASTLVRAIDGELIVVSWDLSTIDVVVSKIDAIDGSVIWSQRYPSMNEAFTITKRNSYYVVMGETTFINNAGDFLAKPMAMAISDVDGSVIWANEYLEGTTNYEQDYKHYVTGATSKAGKIAYVGKFYDAVTDPHGAGQRRVSLMVINASDGDVPVNHMLAYDLELSANDYAIETDAPFPWSVNRVKDPVDGGYDGYAIAGTYSHSDTQTYNATDPVVLRVENDGTPRWATLYGSASSTEGFGRGIKQNAFFFGDRLDVFTSWEGYSADALGTVSGLMRIDATDGTDFGITVYDALNDDFEGLSMRGNGVGGYVGLGIRSVVPRDAFELIHVGSVGGGTDCSTEDPLEPEELEIDDVAVEIITTPVDITPVDYTLPYVSVELVVSDCDGL